ETCRKHLEEVLRCGRPRRLLESIELGLADAKDGVKSEAISHPVPLKVDCQQCPTEGPASTARAYLESPPPRVVLCANRLGSRREIEEGVVHELVHAYDYLVSGLKLTDCRPLAYSEVRAARTAECAETFDFLSFNFFKKRCTRAAASRSTDGLFPGRGADCVDEVFEAAYADEGPSDRK
ncbi:unnamed protein product, partial [Ascophyllum nodosum]